MLRGMYKKHPVRIDIAGTVESISHITAELLYKCYGTFYNLSNMVLCVAGNVDVDTVLSVADKVLKKQPEKKIERKFHEEPKEVCESYVEEYLPVATPVFALGYKEDVKTPERSLKDVICSNIILELVVGKTSKLYSDMLSDGLINTAFGFEFFEGYGYACQIYSGESRDPEKVRELISGKINELKRDGVDEKDFERIRRKLYGRAVFDFNDIESIANEMVSATFNGETVFSGMEVLENLTKEDVEKRLLSSVDTENCVLSVIKSN